MNIPKKYLILIINTKIIKNKMKEIIKLINISLEIIMNI